MREEAVLPGWKDKALFTPGPLTTSRSVKEAMLCDLGSRDSAFIDTVAEIRQRLLALAGVSADDYTAILMQGSGTYGLEAVIGSVLPPRGCLAVLVNGAYGERLVTIARVLNIDVEVLKTPEQQKIDARALDMLLTTNQQITHVAAVHCETTTGIINPIAEVGAVVARRGRTFLVDAMSSFGAYPIDLRAWGIDFLISSANKCIEGVPGFAIVLARSDTLFATRGWARSLSLDLLAQWEGLERNGQFRFTPPTHAILAFRQALIELEAEGGVMGRAARYRRNYEVAVEGFAQLGFATLLAPEDQGYIITSFRYPQHPNFHFEEFYRRLSRRGCVIYPGKLTNADCFRIGHIGRLDEYDVYTLLDATRSVLQEMGIERNELVGAN
ncbi:MAG: 2-aminoethylphosphonate--pyruvate transaminase [Caldilineaceae bacterium]